MLNFKPKLKQLKKETNLEWNAELVSFGVYEYSCEYKNHKILLKSFAHLSPKFDGDDESYEVRWHLYVDNNFYGYIHSYKKIKEVVNGVDYENPRITSSIF